jgi:exosome complex RNA-binding protein Rrp4
MTDTLKVKEKEVVVPGEVIAAGMGYLPGFGTYREGDEIKAAKLGLIHLDSKVVKIVPLSGRYFPRIGDVIIGKVFDLLMTGWRVDTNSSCAAFERFRDRLYTAGSRPFAVLRSRRLCCCKSFKRDITDAR